MNRRRFFAAVLAILMLFSAVSCNDSVPNDSSEQDTTAPPSVDIASDDGRSYTDLTPRDSSSFENLLFGSSEDPSVLQLSMPGAWSLEPALNGARTIRRGDVTVGQIRMGESPLPTGFQVLESDESTFEGVLCVASVVADPSQYAAEDRYSYRFVYHYEINGKPTAVTLTLRYVEVSAFLARKLRVGGTVLPRLTENAIGSIPLSKSAGGKAILILGNSFINSSRIGAALRSMCEATGVPHSVTAVSVGYATVSKSWSAYLDRMRSGEFAAVFMCGFYSSSDVSAFQPYVDACNASSTPIVIFPAHNEGNGESASKNYPKVHFLNWKGEINALIRSGLSTDDFCINDTHKHSTPLAGYVGAHMIYRALFGKVPPQLSYYGEVSHSQVSRLLGDYASTGSLVLIEDSQILFFE